MEFGTLNRVKATVSSRMISDLDIYRTGPRMSALPPKADVNGYGAGCPLLTQSSHRLVIGLRPRYRC